MIRTLLASLAALFISCSTSSRSTEINSPTPAGAVPSNLVLRSYDVPNGGAQRMRGVLRELLWFGSDGKDSNKYIGRADVGPDGRLIVLAPESVHEGVKALVANVTANPVKEPGTVRLDYWVVSGVPGKAEAPAGNLQEVAPALTEVEKNDGPMAFTLVEKLTVSSLSNERGSVDGRDTHVRQFTNVMADEITADIDLERFGQKLATRVRIKPGVLTVLASAGMTTRGDSKDAPQDNRNIYFLVRAADGSGR
ncbi:MAG: hypothetical protein QM817_35305 [Archangium sp.]